MEKYECSNCARVYFGRPKTCVVCGSKKVARVPVASGKIVPRIAPLHVDFGAIKDWDTVLEGEIGVRNDGKSEWKGTVRYQEPWVEVGSTHIACPAGKKVVLGIRFKAAELSHLSSGIHDIHGILLIEGQRGFIWCVSARVNIAIKAALEISPSRVDFGVIDDWDLPTPVETVHLLNKGKRDWRGTVRCNVSWLRSSPTTLVCTAGKEASLRVELTSKVHSLSIGTYDEPGALVLEGEGEKWPIGVRLVVSEAKPELAVGPLSVDFGEVEDWQKAPAQEIKLRNAGKRSWKGIARSTVPWLDVLRPKIDCPAGRELSLKVRLNSEAGRLSVGSHEQSGAILVEGESETWCVDVRVVVTRPQVSLEIAPLLLDFGRTRDWDSTPAQGIWLRNKGKRTWRGTMHCDVAWLEVPTSVIECPAGRRVFLSVRLRPGAKLSVGAHHEPRALLIEGEGRRWHIGVRLSVKTESTTTVTPATKPARASERLKPSPATSRQLGPVSRPTGKKEAPVSDVSRRTRSAPVPACLEGTYYQLLGVDYDVSTEEIHKAYRRLRKRYQSDPGMLEQLKLASLTLENTRSREDYDKKHGIHRLRRSHRQRRISEPAPTDPGLGSDL